MCHEIKQKKQKQKQWKTERKIFWQLLALWMAVEWRVKSEEWSQVKKKGM